MIRITYFWHFLHKCMLPKPWKYFLTVTKIFRVMLPKFWYSQQKCMQMHVGNWHQHAYLHAHGCTCIQNASSISLLKWPKCMHFLLIKCMHLCMHFCGKYQFILNTTSATKFACLAVLFYFKIKWLGLNISSVLMPLYFGFFKKNNTLKPKLELYFSCTCGI